MTALQVPPGDHAGRDDGAHLDGAGGADGSRRRLGSWWARTGPVKRVVVVLAVLVVGVNGAIAALDTVVGRDPGGPMGSSYATDDDGVAAWGDLLRARGVEVVALREPLGEAALPAGGTVVLVEPDDAPTPEGVAGLAEYLAAGGRVVAVGEGGAAWARPLVGVDLGWTPTGTPRPQPRGPLLADLSSLRGEGAGAFTAAGPLTPEAGPADAPVVLAGGGLAAVADATLLDNAHLARADNAALAVVLSGGGPVAFAEAEHGYGAARGLGALPWRWRLTALGLVAATLLGYWSVGQRLGPPEATDRPLAPPRRAYVDALGGALGKGGLPAPAPPDRSPDPGGSP